jgi:predicted Zn-dependent protease
MNKGMVSRVVQWVLILLLFSGFPVQESSAQEDSKAAEVANQFLQAVLQGDSPTAFELCSSGLQRGKTPEDFLKSPEISGVFSGMNKWEVLKVAGKGSILTVVLKLMSKRSSEESFSALGMACLRMRDSYRVRDLSSTPWVSSEARYLRYLSDLYTRLDDMDTAEKTIEEAYGMDPKDPKVSAFMGYMLLEKGTDLEEAKNLIQAALDQEPDDPEFMDFLAWYYHKANQRQESVQWFDKAREAFKKIDGYQSSPEYVRFSSHVDKAKASGWKPTQT